MDPTISGSDHRSSDCVEQSDPRSVEYSAASDASPGAVGGGARYKLMSPAKLPISRSTCITIPPGLSPSSFLESPVLLSNFKAEPSPTTGCFTKPQLIHGFSSSASYSMATAVFSNTNSSDDGTSSCFEFKPHARANMVTADMNKPKLEQSVQGGIQGQAQLLASSQITKGEMALSSNELNLLAPYQRVTSGASSPAEGDGDEFNQQSDTTSGVQASQDQKGSGLSGVAERTSDDGYNWRKYGQKHVKGSEFPRSYYKCTHPNCEVKKLFERSHDGQITEIIYKGTHDHPKPQPSRRCNSAAMSIHEERLDRPSSYTGQDDMPSGRYGQSANDIEPNGTPELPPRAANDFNAEGAGSLPSRNNDEVDDDDQFLKRRRLEMGGFDATPVIKPIREPRVVVQTLSEVDILDDGYRWRKYGQKVVRGNPNPRSYYKCTNVGCPVRKHVERASHDPKAVITTYEGKHNHDVPTAKPSSHDTAGPSAAAGTPRFKAEENNSVSLDLGVGISRVAERSTNYKQVPESENVENQLPRSTSNFRVVPGGPHSTHFGILNAGINQYASIENLSEARNITPLSYAAYSYPQNMGRVVTGP